VSKRTAHPSGNEKKGEVSGLIPDADLSVRLKTDEPLRVLGKCPSDNF